VTAEHNVTSVVVDGDAFAQTTLRRVSSGHWQGSFQYWDGSNTPNSKSQITLLFTYPTKSIRKSFLVRTVHDS
jgi:hypothetical protein